MSKNDDAWGKFIKERNILASIYSPGYAYISAEELKIIGGREPRLLAKQDTLNERPEIFKQNDIAVFPVTNGEYILFRDQDNLSFFSFSEKDLEIPFEIYHSKVNYRKFDSFPGCQHLGESQAIDFAYISSLLRTVTNEDHLDLVIRGRLRSGEFDFTIPSINHNVKVSKVQIEVDAGYESNKCIYLIEAKIGKRDNFHIRQLFYPYLEWSHKSKKKIIPIFLIYTNSKYYIYEFKCSEKYGDLVISRSHCYKIDENPIPFINYKYLINTIDIESEPDIPYPQANDLDKVIDLVNFIYDGRKTKTDIAEKFDFDDRQGDYYANAARYLGLLDKDHQDFLLTTLGKEFVEINSSAERTLFIFKQIIKRPSFRRILKLLVDRNLSLDLISIDEIALIIEEETELSSSTPPRRASTVMNWLRWILENGRIIL